MSAKNQISRLILLFINAKPYLLMIGLQFGMAGNYIFGKDILNHGMSRFVFIVYRNAMAVIALAPFAFFLERYINVLVMVTPSPSKQIKLVKKI